MTYDFFFPAVEMELHQYLTPQNLKTPEENKKDDLILKKQIGTVMMFGLPYLAVH